MTTQSTAAPAASPRVARAEVAGVLLLAMIVCALFYYKWGGSLRAIMSVQASGKLALSPQSLLVGGTFATTARYFGRIWPALTYGILIGAAVRAACPGAWVRRWLGTGGTVSTLRAAMTGAPLMLCSCCVTPVFSSLYRRGAGPGPSLAVMLSSPGFNVAALMLTFALLPMRVALLRVLAAIAIVLGLSAVVGKTMVDRASLRSLEGQVEDESRIIGWRELLVGFGRNVVYMAGITVPLILAGVVISGLLLPQVTMLTNLNAALSVGLVAAIGTLAALPTFFEIPIAMLLLAMGAPVGAVVAFVVAGPIVNLPSLLVLAREAGPRVAVALGVGVWAVATVTGLAAMI